ncbi:MAG: cell division ATPase MinD [Candidatus Aenigmarchaeota archaeon]|nr:cell division ATPase MinD [Candidatus Aenigmarchaeota archaeon]
MARVISIISGKGGVGKTTLGLNIGASLAKHFNKNVTLVDCNVTTSHVGLYLGMYYCPITLNKVLRGEYKVEDAVSEHYSGMKVVPASLSLTDLEGVDITELRSKLKGLMSDNDIVLLDGSPGLGREGIASMRAADEVLYVTNPYIPFVMDIVRCQEIANEIGVKPLGVVVNMSNNKNYEMSDSEIEELTKLPVIAKIPHDTNVHKSLTLKMPVVLFKPYSAASKELISLSSKLVGEVYETEGKLLRFLRKLRIKK